MPEQYQDGNPAFQGIYPHISGTGGECHRRSLYSATRPPVGRPRCDAFERETDEKSFWTDVLP